jgi:hypothetical protein
MSHPPEHIAFLKANLLERIAGGTMPADALTQLHIGWKVFAAWKREDSGFARDLVDAEAHLAEYLAARLARIHETEDHRRALAASRTLPWLCEKLNPKKFGAKVQIEDVASAAELHKILREAIERHARASLASPDPKVLDVTTVVEARRLQRLERSGPPVEGA